MTGLSMASTLVTPEMKKGRNQLAVTVVLGHAVKHIYNAALQIHLMPEIKLNMGLSATQFGALATARQVTGGVTTMGAGYLGDRFAHRSALLLGISMGLLGVSFFLAGSAATYWWLFGAMLLVGIGPSLYHPPAIGALSRKFPDRSGFAISLHGTGGTVGEVLGGSFLIAGLLTVLTWQGVLQVSMLPALVFAVLIWMMMRNLPGESGGASSAREYFAALGTLLRKRAILVLVLVTAMRSMGQSAIMAFLPLYLREDLGYSATVVGIYMPMAQVVGIGAQPVMGLLSDRWGRKAVLVPGTAMLGLLCLALSQADPGPQLMLTILAMGAFLYSLHTIFIAAAMDVGGGEVQSTVVSLIYGASFLGTLSPFLAGVIVDASETSNAFIYGGSIVLASTLVLLFAKLPRTATQDASAREG